MVGRLKPWLLLPSGWAHKIGPKVLKIYGKYRAYQTLTWEPFSWRGLEFTNPLGIAGGVDKNGDCIGGWWALGAGFVEIGTITPLPQAGHRGKVMARNLKRKAVWNKLGFPSKGLDYVVKKIKKLFVPHFTPVFANIGKNKDTPNEKAHDDYIACLKALSGVADAFVINISSPNTEGLRDLLKPGSLEGFLRPIVEANNELAGKSITERATPLLLKISPDITKEELNQVLQISVDLNISGWVLTNTSIGMREGLSFPEEGGISGLPLATKSKELLSSTIELLGEKRKGKLIVSSGGVLTPSDVFERLRMGADLVQVYSALIFEGPRFFRKVSDEASISPGIRS